MFSFQKPPMSIPYFKKYREVYSTVAQCRFLAYQLKFTCSRLVVHVLHIMYCLSRLSLTLSNFIRLNYLMKYSQIRRNLHVNNRGMRGSRGEIRGGIRPPPEKAMDPPPQKKKQNISHIPHSLERKRIRKYSNCDNKLEQIYI